jgi:pilus assembly protein FimV
VQPAQDAPTMVAGLDANSRRMMAEAERRTTAGSPDKDLSASGTWLVDERDAEGSLDFSMSHDAAATAQMIALDASFAESTPDSSRTSQMPALKADDLDLDLGHLGGTTAVRTSGAGLDLDVGSATPANDGTYIATQQVSAEDLALPDLEPVTMSEVGTKLDLARAYMDMGDPEGARNILQEVLQEGSVSQKQEAQRLISSLPG